MNQVYILYTLSSIVFILIVWHLFNKYIRPNYKTGETPKGGYKTTNPKKQPDYNKWISYMQSQGCFVSINNEFKI